MKKINSIYFSATGSTKKIVKTITNKLSNEKNNFKFHKEYDITLVKNRKNIISFRKDDIVVVGLPVYAGRVPNVLVNYLKTINSNGAMAIPVVVYGNRNYDDGLIELKDILEADGFKVIGGGAFIGQHSFSKIIAKDRPDQSDIIIVNEFVERIIEKIDRNEIIEDLIVKGNTPYRKHYMPKDEYGEPVDIRKVKPKTKIDCTDCKICATNCPMASISIEKVEEIKGICIKCCACIKSCPVNAKYFDDINYLRHKEELEIELVERKQPEIFI